MYQIIYPKKIISCSGVENKELLLTKQSPQIELYGKALAHFHKGSHIILDFGKEMRGGIRILVSASDLTPVRIRFGESIAECCSELGIGEEYSGARDGRIVSDFDARRNSTNDHALRDIRIFLPNWSDTPIGDTGFRFVRLDFSGEYRIKSVLCTNTILSKRAKYIYHGEKDVERIYTAAKRTADLCASSGYIWDGIKRDRLVWAGDLAPQVLALSTLYGGCREIENTIDMLREFTTLPGWMDDMPVYSLWWIITLKDYLERTEAYDFIGKQIDYLEQLVLNNLNYVNEDGIMSYPSYFVDWQRHGHSDEREGFRAIAIMSANSAVYLLKKYGRDASNAEKLLRRLSKQEIKPTTKVVAALKHLAVGKLSAEERELLLAGGANGMSTFMSYHILTAAAAYDKKTAWNMMKEYYGGMLSLGSTTFWEDFDIEWSKYSRIDRLPSQNKPCSHGDTGAHCYIGFRKSLCHGWSAGVIAFIKEFGERDL